MFGCGIKITFTDNKGHYLARISISQVVNGTFESSLIDAFKGRWCEADQKLSIEGEITAAITSAYKERDSYQTG